MLLRAPDGRPPRRRGRGPTRPSVSGPRGAVVPPGSDVALPSPVRESAALPSRGRGAARARRYRARSVVRARSSTFPCGSGQGKVAEGFLRHRRGFLLHGPRDVAAARRDDDRVARLDKRGRPSESGTRLAPAAFSGSGRCDNGRRGHEMPRLSFSAGRVGGDLRKSRSVRPLSNKVSRVRSPLGASAACRPGRSCLPRTSTSSTSRRFPRFWRTPKQRGKYRKRVTKRLSAELARHGTASVSLQRNG